VRVRIPTPLRSYTANQTTVEATGDTVGDVLFDLDRQFPGIRFRVVDEQGRLRQHMRVFVNDDFDHNLARVLVDGDELTLMQALSGG
jgi:sulfur-carrier protein